ncbi:hypothetical protein SUSAZ_03725 [Sulfolobus acidocaldarius SUSAZ]|nr:hypothetical protein SUSAZ_03725 [Sulfolobus acidocaldarius SUSAZ]
MSKKILPLILLIIVILPLRCDILFGYTSLYSNTISYPGLPEFEIKIIQNFTYKPLDINYSIAQSGSIVLSISNNVSPLRIIYPKNLTLIINSQNSTLSIVLTGNAIINYFSQNNETNIDIVSNPQNATIIIYFTGSESEYNSSNFQQGNETTHNIESGGILNTDYIFIIIAVIGIIVFLTLRRYKNR